jgi:DNA-binding MarR family transcriptional regulator
MIGSLRARGWVEETTDPADARASRIVVTRAGRDRVRRFEADLARRMEELLPGVSRDELRSLIGTLHPALAETREARLANVFGPAGG